MLHLTASITLVAALAPDAVSEDDELSIEPSRPATWDMDLDALQAIGLGQSRGIPVPAREPPGFVAPIEPQRAEMAVVFVNFEAITLQQGFDDSHNDVSEIIGGDFVAYGGDASARAAVMEAVRIDWAPYNVLIVDTRPAGGDYTMNVTSPTNPFGGGVLGIAPLDCFNQMSKNNITFAFHGANDGFPAPVQATTIGQEVAHSFGLEHVDEPGDIMNPYNSGGDPAFLDECLPVVMGGVCGSQHEPNCGSQFSQNSHQDLLDLFGPSEPDTQAPTVQIIAPGDGAMYPVGAEFEITVMAADDNAVEFVDLYRGDAKLQSDAVAPYGWNVTDIPEGTYQFSVQATDLAGNVATSNVVTVYVGVEMPSDDSGSADGGSADGGSADGTAGEGGTDDPGENGGGDEGCGCNLRSATPPGAALALLLLFTRRRRARVSPRA